MRDKPAALCYQTSVCNLGSIKSSRQDTVCGHQDFTFSCAGSRNLVITMLAIAYLGIHRRMLDLTWVYHNFVSLLSASVAFSFALSAVLYVAALRKGALCAQGGRTGTLNILIHSAPGTSYMRCSGLCALL